MKKVLLDENLPRQLKQLFTADLDVTSVPDLGWQSKKNGELLSAMSAEGIEILLTADKNLRFQRKGYYRMGWKQRLFGDRFKKSLK